MNCRRVVAAAFAAVSFAVAAQSPPSLTIYAAQPEDIDALFNRTLAPEAMPGGYAVVREQRRVELKAGANVIDVADVPRWIEPGAISVRTGAGVMLMGQSFEFDPLGIERLVERSLGQTITVESSNGTAVPVTGTLLSSLGGLVVRLNDGRVIAVTDYQRVTFPSLPTGLSATPALRWHLQAASAGAHELEFAYPTRGLAWRAEYSAWLLPGGDCRVDFGAWASVVNHSGADFRDARVTLVAGEPNRVAASGSQPMLMHRTALADAPAAKGAAERPLGDYHEYVIDMPVDLPGASQSQLALFAPKPLACSRQYLLEGTALRANPGMAPLVERDYGLDEKPGISSQLTFKAERALPAGVVRVLEDRKDAAPALLGEDMLDDTAKDETASLRLGAAFDLVGERTQADFVLDDDARAMTETIAIKARNRGNESRQIVVREHLYRWTQWEITAASTKYEKKNADTIEFTLDVPAGDEARAEYTVRYRWTASFK